MNSKLAAWNAASDASAVEAMIACCGSKRWAAGMVALRPIDGADALSAAADRVWSAMQEPDWLEAFACHPRIGERNAAEPAGAKSTIWSRQEQSSASTASERVLAQIAEGNRLYEHRFGFTYIVCATGKSAEEMLAILTRRLDSSRDGELREAAEQQRQILQIRLGKWLIE
ncbi:MAG: 2-oxo-4-hydroxy-4-carboxy-5-ureidoimidazoline decarboxylase [Terracidiphilus sp.]